MLALSGAGPSSLLFSVCFSPNCRSRICGQKGQQDCHSSGCCRSGGAMETLSSVRGSVFSLILFLLEFATATEIPLSGKATALDTGCLEFHTRVLILSRHYLYVLPSTASRVSLCLFGPGWLGRTRPLTLVLQPGCRCPCRGGPWEPGL